MNLTRDDFKKAYSSNTCMEAFQVYKLIFPNYRYGRTVRANRANIKWTGESIFTANHVLQVVMSQADLTKSVAISKPQLDELKQQVIELINNKCIDPIEKQNMIDYFEQIEEMSAKVIGKVYLILTCGKFKEKQLYILISYLYSLNRLGNFMPVANHFGNINSVKRSSMYNDYPGLFYSQLQSDVEGRKGLYFEKCYREYRARAHNFKYFIRAHHLEILIDEETGKVKNFSNLDIFEYMHNATHLIDVRSNQLAELYEAKYFELHKDELQNAELNLQAVETELEQLEQSIEQYEQSLDNVEEKTK